MVDGTTISYTVSVDEPLADACGGSIIVIAKLYSTIGAMPEFKSFYFNANDFIVEDLSIDKEDFLNSMIDEGFEFVEANTILRNLILIADELTSSPNYSPSRILTLTITVQFQREFSFNDNIWEQEAIQNSFESWNLIPRPATEDSINYLQRLIYTSNQRNEEENNTLCVICQEEFLNEQILLKLPCAHVFDVECLQKWFETNHKCPCCRFELPSSTVN